MRDVRGRLAPLLTGKPTWLRTGQVAGRHIRCHVNYYVEGVEALATTARIAAFIGPAKAGHAVRTRAKSGSVSRVSLVKARSPAQG